MSELSPEEMDKLDETIDGSTEASSRSHTHLSATRPRPPVGEYVAEVVARERLSPDHIEADFRNGVLEVRLPNRAQLKPKRIEPAGGRKALNK
jgi:HSP20 family molecular chaperone IbpA